MVEVIGIVLSLLPPILLLASGWSLSTIFFPNEEGYASSYLISMILGSFVFVIPYLIVGSTIGLLQELVFVHAGFVICLLLYLRKEFVEALSGFHQQLKTLRFPQTFLGAFAAFSLFFYSVRVSITCLLGPIVSGDALYFWLSMGKVFFNLNKIPYYDTFHFWRYSAEPLTPTLFSWGYFFTNSTELEVFRGISVIFFIAMPLLSYELVRTWKGNVIARQFALIIACSTPILDYMITIYSFYADTAAVLFVGLAILLMRKSISTKKASYGLLSGLSLALAILSKYPFGLLGCVIVVIEIIWFLNKTTKARVTTALLTTTLVLLTIIAGNQIWSFASSLTALLVLGILTCFVTLIRSIDEVDTPYNWKTKIGIIGSFIIGVSTSLVWGIKTLLQGAAMFGIPFIRLVPVSSEDLSVASILNQFFGVAETGSKFTPLTLIQFVFNPLMNGFFSIVVLVVMFFAIRKKIGLSMIWILLFWYVGYLSIMGYYSSGRHLLMCAVLLGPFLGVAFTELKSDQTSPWSRLNLSLVAVLFSLSALFQFVTSSLAWIDLDLSLGGIPSLFGIPYTTSFGLETTPELVQRIAMGATLVAFVVLISVFVLKVPSQKEIRNTKILGILALVLSSGLVAPLGIHALSVSSGNLLTYDIKGSWNQGDFILGATLAEIVGEDEIILAFGDVVLSYLGFRILDLFHNGLYALPNIAASENMTQIHTELWSFGVRFLVLPSNNSYLDASYSKFISYVPFPEIATNSNISTMLMELSRWRVYEIIAI